MLVCAKKVYRGTHGEGKVKIQSEYRQNSKILNSSFLIFVSTTRRKIMHIFTSDLFVLT